MMPPLSWLEDVTCAPLSDRAVRLANLLCLVYRNRDTGLICPTQQTMADRLGCSIDTVKRAVAELSKAGWIAVVPDRWRGAPSSYQLATRSGNVLALATPKGGRTAARTAAQTSRTEARSTGKGGRQAIRQAGRKPAPPPPGAVIDLDDAAGMKAWNRWLRSEGFGPLEASTFLAEAGPLRGHAVPKRHPPRRPDDAVRGLPVQLHDEGNGPPRSAILAGAHAEIVGAMVATCGAGIAIERMARAADRIEGLPSAAEARLMAQEAAGHA